jgi:enamine deaminase RidA (YjgF/YER057c/UK114 family)
MQKKVAVWYENPPGSGPPQGLYSHVGFMQGGTLAFIAGQLAVGSHGEVIGKGDFKAQFRQVFSNLRDVLSGMGAEYRQVIKFTTYLVHSQDIGHFMTERQALFPDLFGKEPYPPNTLVVVDRLVKEEFLIEVEAIAAIER